MVRTFIQPERVFVWRSKERAPKPGRIGNLEKSCSGLENSCLHMEKSGKMLEKINSIMWLIKVSHSEFGDLGSILDRC